MRAFRQPLHSGEAAPTSRALRAKMAHMAKATAATAAARRGRMQKSQLASAAITATDGALRESPSTISPLGPCAAVSKPADAQAQEDAGRSGGGPHAG